MYDYTIIQWLFFFYFYCFFGWVFESTYVSICKRKFVNRGFMRGPFLPIYGSGGIMMLVVSMPFQDSLILTYLAGCVGATALELVTGLLMEALFKVRYWDYSDQKFNYKGVICLSSTLAWGGLTIFMTEFLHKLVEKVVFRIPYQVVSIVTVILSVVILVDFTLSFKAALELRGVLVQLEKVKEEMERIQKRLDVLAAFATDELETYRKGRSDRISDLMDSIEDKFRDVREKLKLNPTEYSEDVKEKLAELRGRYFIEKDHHVEFRKVRDFFQRGLIKGNPTMTSGRYAEALEALKKAMNSKKADHEEEEDM